MIKESPSNSELLERIKALENLLIDVGVITHNDLLRTRFKENSTELDEKMEKIDKEDTLRKFSERYESNEGDENLVNEKTKSYELPKDEDKSPEKRLSLETLPENTQFPLERFLESSSPDRLEIGMSWNDFTERLFAQFSAQLKCCGRKFQGRRSVVLHLCKHFPSTAFSCSICKKPCTRSHLHHQTWTILQPDKVQATVEQAFVSEKTTIKKESYYDHLDKISFAVALKSEQIPIACWKCNEEFRSRPKERRNVKTAIRTHLLHCTSSSLGGIFLCQLCDARVDNVVSHRAVQHSNQSCKSKNTIGSNWPIHPTVEAEAVEQIYKCYPRFKSFRDATVSEISRLYIQALKRQKSEQNMSDNEQGDVKKSKIPRKEGIGKKVPRKPEMVNFQSEEELHENSENIKAAIEIEENFMNQSEGQEAAELKRNKDSKGELSDITDNNPIENKMTNNKEGKENMLQKSGNVPGKGFQHHLQHLSKSVAKAAVNRDVFCALCSRVFRRGKNLNRRVVVDHLIGQPTFQCPRCSEVVRRMCTHRHNREEWRIAERIDEAAVIASFYDCFPEFNP